jgi:hypothetical protein
MNKKIVQEIKEKGIFKINNFLNNSQISKFSKIVNHYSAPKNDPESYFPVNLKTLSYKIFKLNFTKFFHSLDLWKLEKNKNLNYLADSFFKDKSSLKFIDAYYSKVSNKAILPWHTDQAYHGKISVDQYNHPDNFFLKIFIYLTDVGPNNGCMSYIPGSHRIGYAIRKSIYEKKISYQPYWNLVDFRKILFNNKQYFIEYLKDESILEDFFNKTEPLLKDDINKNNNFSYEAKAGSAIIFDEGGVHQGSKPQFNDRMVVRYLYSIKKFN